MQEKLNFGISFTLMGLSMTFIILFTLQMVMNSQKWVINNFLFRTKNNGEKLQAKANPEGSIEMSSSEDLNLDKSKAEISPQIIAVIMAAITSQTGLPAQKIKIVNVRKTWDKEASFGWNHKSSQDIINSRSHFLTKGGYY